ncbi:MAG: hypothetical protein EOO07_33215 [Chitinophagaceae bacterium]|nr:MAG: hypothetical protein EOO07_33215 [Chitinophagaceae bacterium]
MAEVKKQPEQICPSNRSEWRTWLMQNHATADSVSLIYYKKKSDKFSMSWSDAVDEALCFGWIDSTRRTLDEERFLQLFTKRKPRGTWSKINKDKIEVLINAGLMTKAGLAVINKAKENGSWNLLNEVEEMIMPSDLKLALEDEPNAKIFFGRCCPC